MCVLCHIKALQQTPEPPDVMQARLLYHTEKRKSAFSTSLNTMVFFEEHFACRSFLLTFLMDINQENFTIELITQTQNDSDKETRKLCNNVIRITGL